VQAGGGGDGALAGEELRERILQGEIADVEQPLGHRREQAGVGDPRRTGARVGRRDAGQRGVAGREVDELEAAVGQRCGRGRGSIHRHALDGDTEAVHDATAQGNELRPQGIAAPRELEAVGDAVAVGVLVRILRAVPVRVGQGRVVAEQRLQAVGEPVRVEVLLAVRDAVVVGVDVRRVEAQPELQRVGEAVPIRVAGGREDLEGPGAVDRQRVPALVGDRGSHARPVATGRERLPDGKEGGQGGGPPLGRTRRDRDVV